MSLSSESLNLRRKRTATERAINNGDPLVVRKRAREATTAAVPKNGTNVSLHCFLRHSFDHHLRQLTLVAVLLYIWKMMMRTLT